MSNFCFCGKEKREDRLTCPRCFELYRQETKGKVGLLQWVKKQALNRLEELGASPERPETGLEIDLKIKKYGVQELEKQVGEETYLCLQNQLAGAGRLRQEEVDALLEDIRKGLWKEKGGNRLYAELKSLEREIEQKVTPLRILLQKIEKMEKDHLSVDKLIGSIFPQKKGS